MFDEMNTTNEQPVYREPAGEVPAELGRAGSLHVLGRAREALEELERLLARDPECADAYRVRAMILMEVGEEVEALGDWERYHSLTAGDVSTRLAQGHCQQKASRWAEAAEQYRSVLAEDPGQNEARLGLGLCLLREFRAEEALDSITRYLESDPQNSAARFGQAVAYHLLSEQDEAARLFEELIQEGYQVEDALTNLVTICREKKDAGRMEVFGRRLLEIAPESQAGLECAAYAAYLREDFAQALDFSERLITIDSRDAGSWMNVGLCRKKLGRLAEAQEAYAEALQRQSDSSEARLRNAELLLELGRGEEALEMCREGIEMSPETGEFYDLASRIHAQAGRVAEVEALLEVLAVRNPHKAETWFRLGNLKMDRKAHGEAQEAYRACLEARQDWPEARLNLSLAYFEAGQADHAERELATLLEQKPDWEPALRAAAVTALKLGKLEIALARHRKLIDAGAKEAEVFYNAALLCDQLGRTDEAEELYRLALGWRPEFTEALVGLGHALESAGRQDEAKQCWARAMELRPELAQDYFKTKR